MSCVMSVKLIRKIVDARAQEAIMSEVKHNLKQLIYYVYLFWKADLRLSI